MRDNLDCDFALERIDALLNVLLRGRTETDRRLIEEQQFGLFKELPRHKEA